MVRDGVECLSPRCSLAVSFWCHSTCSSISCGLFELEVKSRTGVNSTLWPRAQSGPLPVFVNKVSQICKQLVFVAYILSKIAFVLTELSSFKREHRDHRSLFSAPFPGKVCQPQSQSPWEAHGTSGHSTRSWRGAPARVPDREACVTGCLLPTTRQFCSHLSTGGLYLLLLSF